MPAIPRPHPLQRREAAVHVAEIADLRHALELRGRHVANEREDAGHGDIDPDVDRAKLALDPLGGGFHAVGIRDVARQNDGPAAACLDLALRAFQPFNAARDEAEVRLLGFREMLRGRASDAGARAGNDNDSRFGGLIHRLILFRRN